MNAGLEAFAKASESASVIKYHLLVFQTGGDHRAKDMANTVLNHLKV
jgi:hypothetical protein